MAGLPKRSPAFLLPGRIFPVFGGGWSWLPDRENGPEPITAKEPGSDAVSIKEFCAVWAGAARAMGTIVKRGQA